MNASGHNLTLAWDVTDEIILKSISAYREVKRHGANTLGTALPVGISSTNFVYTWGGLERVDQDQTSQEFQLIGSWDQFDLTVGGMYYNERVTDYRQSRLTGPGLIGPVTFILPAAIAYCVDFALDPCPTTSAEQSAESTSYGSYAQGRYRPTMLPGLEPIPGLRYTDDQKDALRYMSSGARATAC